MTSTIVNHTRWTLIVVDATTREKLLEVPPEPGMSRFDRPYTEVVRYVSTAHGVKIPVHRRLMMDHKSIIDILPVVSDRLYVVMPRVAEFLWSELRRYDVVVPGPAVGGYGSSGDVRYITRLDQYDDIHHYDSDRDAWKAQQ